jgi:hypothetical protein
MSNLFQSHQRARALSDPHDPAPLPPDPDAEQRDRFARLRAMLGESPHHSATDQPAA